MKRLRVIQWYTGDIACHQVRLIHTSPALELVGALVYHEEKAGLDVGEIVGIGPIGVITTSDPEVILALDADCVLYNPPTERYDEIIRMLASGKNVISIMAGWNPTRKRCWPDIQKACESGNSSLYGTGLNPGLSYELALPHDGRQFDTCFEPAQKEYNDKILIREGTMAGLLVTASTTCRGAPVVTIELRFLLDDDYVSEAFLASRPRHGWIEVDVRGTPGSRIMHELYMDETVIGIGSTGTRAFYAIPAVCAATRGLLSPLDLPLSHRPPAVHPSSRGYLIARVPVSCLASAAATTPTRFFATRSGAKWIRPARCACIRRMPGGWA